MRAKSNGAADRATARGAATVLCPHGAHQLLEGEVRTLAERSLHPRVERLVLAQRSAAVPGAQGQEDQLALGTAVERLERGEALDVARRRGHVPALARDVGERLEDALHQCTQTLALRLGPPRVRLVGDEVAPVQRDGLLERGCGVVVARAEGSACSAAAANSSASTVTEASSSA
jgi:hypothetical protein